MAGRDPDDRKLVVLVRNDLKMTKGKIAAQVAHAAVNCAFASKKKDAVNFNAWYDSGQAKVVLRVDSERELFEFKAVAEALGQRDLQKSLAVADSLVSQSKNPEQTARALIMSAAGFFRQSLRILVLMHENRLATPVALKRYLEALPGEKKSKDRREITGLHPYRAMKLAEQARR